MGSCFAAKRTSPGLENDAGGQASHDRRLAARKAVSLEVAVVAPDGTSSAARVFNLSASGMLIADLPFRPEIGDVHEFKLDMAGEPIGLRGVVRRRQTIPHYGNAAGIAFVGLPDRVRAALLEFLFGVRLLGASA